MAVVRLFAAAREAAGTGRADLPGTTVAEVVAAAVAEFGPRFEAVAASATIWLNGDKVPLDTAVTDADEVAVLPPVSGG